MMVTDFHSHILPGVDDGSDSIEESVAMLRLEAEQGISHVIATPHFYPRHDNPERFLERRARAEAMLRPELEKDSSLPELSVGAEVHFFSGMSQSDILPLLTMAQKCCILIEMPPAPWTDSMYRELENIWHQRGIVPVIAHVDRYISRFRSYGIPERLAQLPVMVQANAGFFLQPATASMALRMLKKGQIHLLGSDCHNLSDRRPNLGAAVDKIRARLGEQAVERILSLEREMLCK